MQLHQHQLHLAATKLLLRQFLLHHQQLSQQVRNLQKYLLHLLGLGYQIILHIQFGHEQSLLLGEPELLDGRFQLKLMQRDRQRAQSYYLNQQLPRFLIQAFDLSDHSLSLRPSALNFQPAARQASRSNAFLPSIMIAVLTKDLT